MRAISYLVSAQEDFMRILEKQGKLLTKSRLQLTEETNPSTSGISTPNAVHRQETQDSTRMADSSPWAESMDTKRIQSHFNRSRSIGNVGYHRGLIGNCRLGPPPSLFPVINNSSTRVLLENSPKDSKLMEEARHKAATIIQRAVRKYLEHKKAKAAKQISTQNNAVVCGRRPALKTPNWQVLMSRFPNSKLILSIPHQNYSGFFRTIKRRLLYGVEGSVIVTSLPSSISFSRPRTGAERVQLMLSIDSFLNELHFQEAGDRRAVGRRPLPAANQAGTLSKSRSMSDLRQDSGRATSDESEILSSLIDYLEECSEADDASTSPGRGPHVASVITVTEFKDALGDLTWAVEIGDRREVEIQEVASKSETAADETSCLPFTSLGRSSIASTSVSGSLEDAVDVDIESDGSLVEDSDVGTSLGGRGGDKLSAPDDSFFFEFMRRDLLENASIEQGADSPWPSRPISRASKLSDSERARSVAERRQGLATPVGDESPGEADCGLEDDAGQQDGATSPKDRTKTGPDDVDTDEGLAEGRRSGDVKSSHKQSAGADEREDKDGGETPSSFDIAESSKSFHRYHYKLFFDCELCDNSVSDGRCSMVETQEKEEPLESSCAPQRPKPRTSVSETENETTDADLDISDNYSIKIVEDETGDADQDVTEEICVPEIGNDLAMIRVSTPKSYNVEGNEILDFDQSVANSEVMDTLFISTMGGGATEDDVMRVPSLTIDSIEVKQTPQIFEYETYEVDQKSEVYSSDFSEQQITYSIEESSMHEPFVWERKTIWKSTERRVREAMNWTHRDRGRDVILVPKGKRRHQMQVSHAGHMAKDGQLATDQCKAQRTRPRLKFKKPEIITACLESDEFKRLLSDFKHKSVFDVDDFSSSRKDVIIEFMLSNVVIIGFLFIFTTWFLIKSDFQSPHLII